MIRLHRNTSGGYYQIFNYETGLAIREGKRGKEVFWREEGPELLDISITDYCEKECEFCYRKASRHGSFMELSCYENILQQAERAGVQQIALGGGNPNQHPLFIKFLELTRKYHIIPSFTTNGQGMTEEIYQATEHYAGAVAVSWYFPYQDAIRVIEMCHKYGITVNIHYMLHKESVSSAIKLLSSDNIPWEWINAIVFLNYKPKGREIYKVIQDNKEMDEFLDYVTQFKKCKVGFDSCMISWLIKVRKWIRQESIDFCEAGRFSAFISEKESMYPCSFLCGNNLYGEDLKEKTLQEIWTQGKGFQKIRKQLSTIGTYQISSINCRICSEYELCHGGCPMFDINRCR